MPLCETFHCISRRTSSGRPFPWGGGGVAGWRSYRKLAKVKYWQWRQEQLRCPPRKVKKLTKSETEAHKAPWSRSADPPALPAPSAPPAPPTSSAPLHSLLLPLDVCPASSLSLRWLPENCLKVKTQGAGKRESGKTKCAWEEKEGCKLFPSQTGETNRNERSKLPQFFPQQFPHSPFATPLAAGCHHCDIKIGCSFAALGQFFTRFSRFSTRTAGNLQRPIFAAPFPPHTRMLCSINETLDSFPQRSFRLLLVRTLPAFPLFRFCPLPTPHHPLISHCHSSQCSVRSWQLEQATRAAVL